MNSSGKPMKRKDRRIRKCEAKRKKFLSSFDTIKGTCKRKRPIY